jgi:hypothetical protein
MRKKIILKTLITLAAILIVPFTATAKYADNGLESLRMVMPKVDLPSRSIVEPEALSEEDITIDQWLELNHQTVVVAMEYEAK